MKIYFSASIRGGVVDKKMCDELVELLGNYGEVLQERNALDMTDEEIYERDMVWLRESDVLVAEITTPSLGVGYEIAYAEILNKPVLCLYQELPGKRLSAMISGDKKLKIVNYKEVSELTEVFNQILK